MAENRDATNEIRQARVGTVPGEVQANDMATINQRFDELTRLVHSMASQRASGGGDDSTGDPRATAGAVGNRRQTTQQRATEAENASDTYGPGEDQVTTGITQQEKESLKEEIAKNLKMAMHEDLQHITGARRYGNYDLAKLGMSDLQYPEQYEQPDFIKFDGTSNPIQHLKGYVTQMQRYSRDEKFMIEMFHGSLQGSAFNWFLDLEPEQKKDWVTFARSFMEKFGFNLDTAPTREQLAFMRRRSDETFRKYAQRWMLEAGMVKPPLTNNEQSKYFVSTLGERFSVMAAVPYANFADMVAAGERIEAMTKRTPGESRNSDRKTGPPQKSEVQNVHVTIPSQYSSNQASSSVPPNSRPPVQRPPRDNRPFPAMGVNKAQLLELLLDQGLATVRPPPAIKEPLPTWYNPNLTCKFHSNAPGHSLDNCIAFKTLVLTLVDQGKILIEAQQQQPPNVQNNPLPNHGNGGPTVGAVGTEPPPPSPRRPRMSMKLIWQGLQAAGYTVATVTKSAETGAEAVNEAELGQTCPFHHSSHGHTIEECPDFLEYVLKLQVFGVLQLGRSSHREVQAVDDRPLIIPGPSSTVAKVPSQSNRDPLVIKSSSALVSTLTEGVANLKVDDTKPELRFLVPAPFAYQSNQQVPWVYETKVESNTGAVKIPEISPQPAAQGITRAGRCYTSEEIERQRLEKLKNIEGHPPRDSVPADDEFLRVMKRSEYSVSEQLKKTPARISLFDLIMSSESHRAVLQDLLNKAFVRPDITTENLVSMVDPVKHKNTISFSSEEIDSPTEAKALYLTVTCCGFVAGRALIDGGSALNVMPLNVLEQLPIEKNTIQDTAIMVRAFDGSASQTMGNIMLPLMIGPGLFQVNFDVMDIRPSYSMLLGRPWIHAAGAVPSTLHQKIKFPWNETIVAVRGEEEFILTAHSSVPQIEIPEDAAREGLHSFEVIKEVSSLKSAKQKVKDGLPERIMSKMGYQPGQGLGLNQHGIKAPIEARENPGRQGLGFDPYQASPSRPSTNKIPHIRKTFPFPAQIIEPEIGATTDEIPAEIRLRPHSGEVLSNWELENVYDVVLM